MDRHSAAHRGVGRLSLMSFVKHRAHDWDVLHARSVKLIS